MSSSRAGETMANDPLSLSDVMSESPSEADYQAVYVELTATERGRNFLAVHNSRHPDSDTRQLLSTVARLEAAMRDNPAQQIPVTLFRGLTDLARAIEQSQAVVSASSISAADDLLAVERIHDIGVALRRRDVEPALCDALEEAAREVGDAIVRSNAAAAGTLSIASLLNDLLAPINNLIARFDSAKSPGAELPAAREAPGEEATFDERTRVDHVEPAPGVASETTVNDETQSKTGAERFHLTTGESAVPVGSRLDSPLPDGEVQASVEEASGALSEPPLEALPQIKPKPEPEVGAKTALPPDILRPAEPPTRHAAQSDSLADLLALSEEELIALFS